MSDGDPWRLRCPEGHAAIEQHTDTYHCSACGETYPGTPYDAAEHEFPVDGPDPLEQCTVGWVLRRLYAHAGDTSTTARVDHLGDRTRVIGKRLHAARDRGLVERIGASSPYRWRLTQRGYDKSRPLRNSNVADALAGVTDDLGMSPVGPQADE